MQRSTSRTDIFQFINTSVDADEPKSAIIRELAERTATRARRAKGKIAIVAGPAMVRTGAGEHLQRLIEAWVTSTDFSPEMPFAVYDVERALFGTSLGIESGQSICRRRPREPPARHQCSFASAAASPRRWRRKSITGGVMHACVRHKVDIVLTGSIRDEGPIPGVTTDIVEAQKIMRAKLADVTHVLAFEHSATSLWRWRACWRRP